MLQYFKMLFLNKRTTKKKKQPLSAVVVLWESVWPNPYTSGLNILLVWDGDENRRRVSRDYNYFAKQYYYGERNKRLISLFLFFFRKPSVKSESDNLSFPLFSTIFRSVKDLVNNNKKKKKNGAILHTTK